MAILKCKICGGELSNWENQTIVTCEYCGNPQTIKTKNKEYIENIFQRANALRLRCDFDKAEKLYERIIEEDPQNAEAYWGIILCRYGIVYVDDPKTGKRLPTCNRVSNEVIVADEDYKMALQYADVVQRNYYEMQAKEFDRIQKEILAISSKEEPFDVFICYKEKDEKGKRTYDSVIANQIYHELTKEGLKVFYAAITLEDKLGSAYEPIIFAALNSSKVMIVLGTKPEYFEAVWVKNEWNRYLALIKKGENKVLIPAFKDMDAYELPEEFAHLQAQDMNNIGFMSDITRGIYKILDASKPKKSKRNEFEINEVTTSVNIKNLIRRAQIYLEDEEWESAEEYSERLLDEDPENSIAYITKLCIELKLHNIEEIGNPKSFNLEDVSKIIKSKNYQRILKIGDEEIITKIKLLIKENKYRYAKVLYESENIEKIEIAIDRFKEIIDYQDANEYVINGPLKINKILYGKAKGYLVYNNIENYSEALRLFTILDDYEDSKEMVEYCRNKVDELNYLEACNLMQENSYESYQKAIQLFEKNKGYKDSENNIRLCNEAMEILVNEEIYQKAIKHKTYFEYEKAIVTFQKIITYKDSNSQIALCNELMESEKKRKDEEFKKQQKEEKLLERKERRKKILIIVGIVFLILALPIAGLTANFISEVRTEKALELLEQKDYQKASELFEKVPNKVDMVNYFRTLTKRISATNGLVEHDTFLIGGSYQPKKLVLEFDFENVLLADKKYEFYESAKNMNNHYTFDYYRNKFTFLTENKVDYACTKWEINTISFKDNILELKLQPHFEDRMQIKEGILEGILIPETKEIIPDSVKVIKNNVFTETLETVIIPKSVENIELDAFSKCINLEYVYYEGTIEDWCKIKFDSVKSNPMYHAKYFYIKNGSETHAKLENVVIPETITKIGDFQFAGFDCLLSITLHDGIKEIGLEAFSDCVGLSKLTIPNSVEKIGFGIVYKCWGLTELSIPFIGEKQINPEQSYFGYLLGAPVLAQQNNYMPAKLKTIKLTNEVNISMEAFKNLSYLVDIYLNNSIFSFGKDCFAGCISLENVYYSGSIQDWCRITFKSENSTPMHLAERFYYLNETNNFVELIDLVVPEGVGIIGDYQFYGFDYLKTAIFPSTISKFGTNVLKKCTRIEKLTIPYVGRTKEDTTYSDFMYLFGGNVASEIPSSLINVVVKGGTIKEKAFAACSYLKNIYLDENVISVESRAFEHCSNATIYLETSSVPTNWDEDWNSSNVKVVFDYPIE